MKRLETNEMYGQWKVIRFIKRNHVEVKCSCGEVGIRKASHLESGRTTSCKSCASKRTASTYGMPSNSKAVGDLGGTYYNSLMHGALRRGLQWNVSRQYLWDLFKGHCALTGQEITLNTRVFNNGPDYKSFNASLDRIDSNKGYVEGNVQWVHKDINRLKNNYSQNEFIQMCRSVSRYANQQPSLENDIEVSRKVQRLEGEESDQ